MQAPRDRRGAPGRQIICFPGALRCLQKTHRPHKNAADGFTIICIIVNLALRLLTFWHRSLDGGNGSGLQRRLG